MRKSLLFLIMLTECLLVNAQSSKLCLKGNWIFTDIQLSKDKCSKTMDALIDTGCTFCALDSTYAVDSCRIPIDSIKPTSVIRGKDNMKSVRIDSLAFCGRVYKGVFCIVFDMRKQFMHHAPDFIVGANVLYDGIWKFDMKDSVLYSLKRAPKESGRVMKLKNWKKYKDIPVGYVVLEGVVGKEKVRFVFDTGTKSCRIPRGIYDGPKETITKETANIFTEYTIIQEDLYKDVPLTIGKEKFSVDFLVEFLNAEEIYNFGLLGIELFKGHSFILDYKNNTLTILD